MSRVAITLDEHALAELQRRATANKEPASRTAARIIRDGLLSTEAATATTPTRAEPAAEPRQQEQTGGAPPWVEPVEQPQHWRRELWVAVSGLQERYPRALGRLPANWTTDRSLTETLAALCVWRSQLDAGVHDDPRAELLFHDRLEIIERQLTHTDDPTAQRFTGGTPPSDWVT